MVVVVVVGGLLLVYNPLHVLEMGHVAWYGDGALLLEAVLLLSLLEQLHEQRMIEVNHGHHEPLLLLPLPHHYREATLWYVPRLPLAVVQQVREMEVEAEQVLVPAPHRQQQKSRRKKSQEIATLDFFSLLL